MKLRIDKGERRDSHTSMHFHTDGMGNEEFTIETYQDAEPVLNNNARLRQYYRENPQRGPMREVAEIPMTIVLQWKEEGVDIFDPSPEMRNRLRAKLDDPQWRYLRTDESRLGKRFF